MTLSRDEKPSGIAVQEQCPDCLHKHYPSLVAEISDGKKGCEFCHRPAGRLTNAEYRLALANGRRAAAQAETIGPDGTRSEPGA